MNCVRLLLSPVARRRRVFGICQRLPEVDVANTLKTINVMLAQQNAEHG
jgi:hypothetical protein